MKNFSFVIWMLGWPSFIKVADIFFKDNDFRTRVIVIIWVFVGWLVYEAPYIEE